jgi:Peptidase_C39 like family
LPDPDTHGTSQAFPSVTQYATPRLIKAIAYDGHPPGDDPGWPDSGAPSQESYAFWCTRLCGMACLKMALTARDGTAPHLFELLDGCLAYEGYDQRPDGTVAGLYYAPFAQFTADKYGISAEVITELSSSRIKHELDMGRLVMASVHKEIRRPELPAPGRGGHLVLVTGHSEGRFHFRNPSGHTPAAVTASMTAGLFDSYAAHRGISMHVAPEATHARA